MLVYTFLQSLFVATASLHLTDACGPSKLSRSELLSITAKNENYRHHSTHRRSQAGKTVIDNVRVFNGEVLQPPSSAVIDCGRIGYVDVDLTGANHIDAQGANLLPGLIDSHSHLKNISVLQSFARYGVTTAMTMACQIPQACTSLQNHTGLPDILCGTSPAAAPNSVNGKINLTFNNSALNIDNRSQVPSWLRQQLAPTPDYVRITAESPFGLSQKILNELVSESHDAGKRVVCHAPSYDGFNQAITAVVDQIHHAPLDKLATPAMAERILRQGQIVMPTLTMMKNSAEDKGAPDNYTYAMGSVALLHQFGIPIVTGTDSNELPGVPANVPFGISLHQELENLVAIGMSNAEVLRAATVLPALQFGLFDRGAIAPGMRADLLLVEGNPLENITASQNIKKVCLAGIEYPGL